MQSSAAPLSPSSQPDTQPILSASRLEPAWLWGLIPAIGAITYPYALKYSYLVGATPPTPSLLWQGISIFALIWAMFVPAMGLYFARQLPGNTHMRRLAYLSVVAPALYVFLGEIQRIFHSPVSDELVWWTLWIILIATGVSASQDEIRPSTTRSAQRWRAVHAVNAVFLTLFVLFHLLNQSASFFGENTYTLLQTLFGRVYRLPVIEAILVGLMISQVISGIRIAWKWGPLKTDAARVMQVGAGMFLAVFILAHMLSIFLYTRTIHAVPTDWNYAIAAPHGLLHDLWNIRLIPYYGYAVFFVLSHIISGVRWIAIQRGADLARTHRLWFAGHVGAVAVSLLVLIGMITPTL